MLLETNRNDKNEKGLINVKSPMNDMK